MINRLKVIYGEQGRQPAKDFFVIATECVAFFVTREAAERVLRELDSGKPPRWIRFRDLSGSEVSVRGSLIETVCESTEGQRAFDRAFQRARRREQKADRQAWEEEDDE